MGKKEQRNYRVLLTQPQFLKLLFANVVSCFGDSLDVIAYSWIMYEVTGSESLMALIMGLNYVPTGWRELRGAECRHWRLHDERCAYNVCWAA